MNFKFYPAISAVLLLGFLSNAEATMKPMCAGFYMAQFSSDINNVAKPILKILSESGFSIDKKSIRIELLTATGEFTSFESVDAIFKITYETADKQKKDLLFHAEKAAGSKKILLSIKPQKDFTPEEVYIDLVLGRILNDQNKMLAGTRFEMENIEEVFQDAPVGMVTKEVVETFEKLVQELRVLQESTGSFDKSDYENQNSETQFQNRKFFDFYSRWNQFKTRSLKSADQFDLSLEIVRYSMQSRNLVGPNGKALGPIKPEVVNTFLKDDSTSSISLSIPLTGRVSVEKNGNVANIKATLAPEASENLAQIKEAIENIGLPMHAATIKETKDFFGRRSIQITISDINLESATNLKNIAEFVEQASKETLFNLSTYTVIRHGYTTTEAVGYIKERLRAASGRLKTYDQMYDLIKAAYSQFVNRAMHTRGVKNEPTGATFLSIIDQVLPDLPKAERDSLVKKMNEDFRKFLDSLTL